MERRERIDTMAITNVIEKFSRSEPVQRAIFQPVIDFSVDNTTGEVSKDLNGALKGAFVIVPNLEGSGTVTLNILDEDNNVYFSKAGIAENTTTVLETSEFQADGKIDHVAGKVTVEIISSVAQIADQTIDIILLFSTV